MAESDKVFAGSTPKFYDTLMVPLIFEAYAAHMAELVAAFLPDTVLETAAGSGAVTRALAPRLKSDARYVVTDLNQSRSARRQLACAHHGPRGAGDRPPPWRRPRGRQDSGACERGGGGVAECRRRTRFVAAPLAQGRLP